MSKYQQVPLDEEQQPLRQVVAGGLPDKAAWIRDAAPDRGPIIRRLERLPSHWAWLAHALLLTASLTLFVLSFCNTAATDADFTSRYSSYSPAASAVEYSTVRYNMTPSMSSPYMGFGPDVDERWHRISADMGDQMISHNELVRLGLPETARKVTDPSTGVEGYRVGLEVFHQLHCLNFLRQAHYSDYYAKIDGNDAGADPKEVQWHVDHCIETIRIALMCSADVGVFSITEYPDFFVKKDMWPNFNTLHVCRNFDAIHDWAVENSVAWGRKA